SAVAVQAHAYTSGSHVVFQRGRYNTSSTAGRRVLAHELTHVVQQRNGPVAGTPTGEGYSLRHPDDRDERAADKTAAAAVSGPAPDQNVQRRTEPSARGQRPAVGEAGQVVQRRGHGASPPLPVQRAPGDDKGKEKGKDKGKDKGKELTEA